jgi:hypothetical protein
MLYGFEVHAGYVVLGDKFINSPMPRLASPTPTPLPLKIANASYKSTSYSDVSKSEP